MQHMTYLKAYALGLIQELTMVTNYGTNYLTWSPNAFWDDVIYLEHLHRSNKCYSDLVGET